MTRAAKQPDIDPQWITTASDKRAVAEGCWFDPGAAERPVKFIEGFIRVPDPDNPTRTVPMVLMEWQRRAIMAMFGWRRADGTRRFRFAWWEVPKKQGKSTLAAALVLLLLIADGEADPEIYSAATTRQQAGIVYQEAAKMVERSPALRKIIDPKAHVKRLVFPRLHGFYAVLPNKPAAVDGINAHALIFDEIHRQANRELYDALQYASVARSQPMQIILTTAGDDRDSIGWELHERAQNILRGSMIDPETFVLIAAADDGDDPGDPATWRKANPSLGVTIRQTELAAEYERARDSPARMTNFKRLRLNQWVSRASRWLDYDRWAACPARPRTDQFSDRECYGGLDLSSKFDLTAFVLQFPSQNESGQRVHDVLAWHFLPEENIAEQEKLAGVPYRAWAEQGLIELTPGDYIDHDYVRRRIRDDIAPKYDVQEIAFDPAFAQQIAIQLMDDGLEVFEFWQRPTMISPVLRYLESTVIEGRLRHGDNPLLNWQAGNVEVVENKDGLIKAVKPKNARKIDGIVALAMAMGNHCKTDLDEATQYQSSPAILF